MGDKKKEILSQEVVPPYIAYRTFINFISTLSEGVPGRVDRGVMRTMSGGVQIQLMSTLKFLGLISEDGTTTNSLVVLAESDSKARKGILEELLKSCYPFVFEDGIDLATATFHQLEEKFKKTGAGGGTVRKCLRFFIEAAKDAEIPLSRFMEVKAEKRNVSKRKAVPKSKTQKKKDQDESAGSSDLPEQPEQLGWIELFLSKFPDFDPSWSDEIQAKWFDGFDQLMKRVEMMRKNKKGGIEQVASD